MGVKRVGKAIHDELRLSDFGVAADVDLVADVWNPVGEYQVGITEQIELGYGFGNQETAEGRIHATLKDVALADVFTGRVRFVIADNEGTVLNPRIFQATVDLLSRGATDVFQRLPLVASNEVATRERKILMQIKPDAARVLDVSLSNLKMSITRYSL